LEYGHDVEHAEDDFGNMMENAQDNVTNIMDMGCSADGI